MFFVVVVKEIGFWFKGGYFGLNVNEMVFCVYWDVIWFLVVLRSGVLVWSEVVLDLELWSGWLFGVCNWSEVYD